MLRDPIRREALDEDALEELEEQPEDHGEVRRRQKLDELLQRPIGDDHQAVVEEQFDVCLELDGASRDR